MASSVRRTVVAPDTSQIIKVRREGRGSQSVKKPNIGAQSALLSGLVMPLLITRYISDLLIITLLTGNKERNLTLHIVIIQ